MDWRGYLTFFFFSDGRSDFDCSIETVQIETAHSQQRNTLTSATRKSMASTFGTRHGILLEKGLISVFFSLFFGPQLATPYS